MAPRKLKTSEVALPNSTLVVDNGGYNIKAGLATEECSAQDECTVIPNCLAKTARNQVLVGSELRKWSDFAETTFRRPVQKGFVVSWEAEKQIWDHEFFDPASILKCDPHETNLLLTEAPNGLSALQTNCDQMVFEEFEFAAYRRCIGPSLNAYNEIARVFRDPVPSIEEPAKPVESMIVVDCGYSHTTVTPLYQGRPIQQAIQRLDIGGKFLTSYLKELLSVRQMDVRSETYMVNQMKEETFFVSRAFRADLDSAKTAPEQDGIVLDYILPDYTSRTSGQTRKHDPVAWKQMRTMGFVQNANGERESFLKLGNERFIIPELLFNPRDAGIDQPGIPDMIMRSLACVPTGLWPIMLGNVYVVGGSSNSPNFVDRLFEELRQISPDECMVRVQGASDPIGSTWLGGTKLCSNRTALKEVMVTRQDYQEHGATWLQHKFSSGAPT